MKLFRSLRSIRHGLEDTVDFASREGVLVLRNVGLVSAGVLVLAAGVVVGRELRQRYKFLRRTPYDAYAHAGEQEVEFGVGV